jgi:hypothetical protein
VSVPDPPVAGSSAVSPADPGSIGLGLLLLLGLHLFQIPLALVAGWVWISVSQMFYVVPAAIVLARTGRSRTHKGLWIGAGITALLNATCFGLLLVALANADFR